MFVCFISPTFLCPPPQFICSGLADIGLGRSIHIFEQGLRRAEGVARLNFIRVFPSIQTQRWPRRQDVYLRCCFSCPTDRQLISEGSAHWNNKENRKNQRRRPCDKVQRGTKTRQLQEVNNSDGEKHKLEEETDGNKRRSAAQSGIIIIQEVHTLVHQPLTSGARAWGGGHEGSAAGPICMSRPRLCGHVQHLASRQGPTPLCGGQSGRLGSAFDPGPSIHL